MVEAEEASQIVNQAAGQGVNIWLGTSIDESMRDEIRVTVVATGVRQERVEKVVTPQARPTTNYRETVRPAHSHGFDRHFDMAETAELPKQNQRRSEQVSRICFW